MRARFPPRNVQRRAAAPPPAREGARHRAGHDRGKLMASRMSFRLPADQQALLDALLASATSQRWAARLFERDTSLWTEDAGVAEAIADRLGWLDAPAHFAIQ